MPNSNALLPARSAKDFLQTTVGDFGPWQCRISILMALLKFPIAWFQFGIIFLAPPTEFWCRQPEDFKHMTKDNWKEYIKVTENITSDRSCKMLNVELSGEYRQIKIPCKWGYDYDRSTVHESIISEWNLVCGREFLVEVVQMTFMFGVLLGNIIFGVIADRYGRKKTLLACVTMQALFGLFSAWSPFFVMFIIMRFLLAISNGGTVIISFVMCMEVVGGKWRTIIPILYQIPFGIGSTLMAVLAFYFREWRDLQLLLSGISLTYIIYFWFLPESPRWLIATKRKEEAILVVEKAIRFNKAKAQNVRNLLEKYCSEGRKEKPNFSQLITTVSLRKRTVLLCTNWFIYGIIFYAFTQYMGQIGKNIFINVTIAGLISIPGTLLCIFIVNRYGRRWTITCSYLFTAICFIIILFIPLGVFQEDWPRIVVAAFGIIGLAVAVPVLYLYTGELFPTIMRNTALGGCVMFSKLGSILAPLVISLRELAQFLPLLTLGVLTVLAASIILPLPESQNVGLPDTVNDIEMRVMKDADLMDGNAIILTTSKNQRGVDLEQDTTGN